MRSFLLLNAVSLLFMVVIGCGQGKSPDYSSYYVNLGAVKVDWEGNVADDSKLKADFDATLQCVAQQSLDAVKTTSYPKVVVIDDPTFPCEGQPDTHACTGFLTDTIYINKAELYTYVFTHEAVHWIAQVGNDQHFRAYFQCTYMVDTFYQ